MKSYSELRQMDDIRLAREGWRRNEHGGLSRLRRGSKTWGIVGLVKGFLGGAAPAAVAAARMQICRACQAKDSSGKRLYRRSKGQEHCGRPRLEKLAEIRRDETRDGCGCELTLKTSKAEAACPLGRWLALSQNDAPPLKLYDPSEPPPAVPPAEPHDRDAIEVGASKPCGCGKSSVSKE